MSIRVFIVEDHPVYRDTLVEYVGLSPDLELCGVAASGEEAVKMLESSGAEVLVTDLSLPGMSGFALLEQVRERTGLPCLVLSGRAQPNAVDRAFEAGASGYLLKGRPQELSRAIQAVADGGRFVSPALDLLGKGSDGT